MNDAQKSKAQLIKELSELRSRSAVLDTQGTSDRKLDKEALAASEVKYRRLFEAAKDGILILDAETGIVVDVNPFLVEMLGYSHEQFLGKKVWELGFLKDILSNHANFEELQKKGYVRYEDMPLETANGLIRDVEFVSNVYNVNHHKVIQCNIRDISDRKRAEEALQQSERKFRETVTYLDEGYYSVTLEGILLDHNLAFNRLLGLDPNQDMKGAKLPDFWQNPDDRKEYLRKFAEKGFVRNFLINAKQKSGDKIVVIANAHLVKDDLGKPLRIDGTFIDITERKQAEEVLKRTRDILEEAKRVARLGNWEWDAINDKITGSEEFYRLFDVAPEEIDRFALFTERLHPDDRKRVEQDVAAALQRDKPYDTDYRVKLSNDGWRAINARGRVFTNADGKPLRMAGTCLDITERKRAEEALVLQKRIADIFLTILDEGMYYEVLKVILDVMHSPFGVFGYIDEAGALVVPTMTRDIWDKCQVPEKTITFPRDSWGNSSWPRAIREKKPNYSNEISTKTPEGHVTLQRHISLPILLQGEVIGLFQVANKETDYTEEDMRTLEAIAGYVAPVLSTRLANKRSEEALRESEDKFRTLAESTWDWVYWLDNDYRFIFNSPSCERITGHVIGEFLRDPTLLMAIVHPEDRVLMAEHLETHHSSTEHDELKFRIVRGDGEVRWIDHVCKPIISAEGSHLGRCSSNRDITDRERAEEEIIKLNAELEERVRQRTAELGAANKELEAFAFSVSHDLRAPLRAIDGFAKILVEDFPLQLGDEGKRLCSILSDNARNMGKLIDDLLTFSRLGRTGMQLSRIDMGTLANSIFHELTTPENRARIDFQVESAPQAFGDPTLIRQVWVNLLSNAVKFSSKRERSAIMVRGEIREDEIIYSIQDNGAGFDMKYVDKLFGVFQRLHTAREFEGTGVGLAIVQRIIHRHGGRVWAEGETDKGATFYFTLK